MNKELMPLENVNAVAIFQEGGLDELLNKIHAEAESHISDITTDKGRKAVASIAAKVAKSKTYLDGAGKDLVSGWKNQAKVVDAQRRIMRDDLDELKAKVRQPLTEYEAAEDTRVNAITDAITDIAEIANTVQSSWLQSSLDEIKGCYAEIREIYKGTSFDERAEYAAEVFDSAKTKIIIAMDQRENYDKEQEELENLRTEAVEREENERIAANKRERIEREKRIAEEAVKAEQDRVIEEREEAKNREAQAITDKEAAEERAKQAEADAKEVTARAEQVAREKLAREQQAEKDAAEKRERNTKHKAKINNEAVDAIIEASGVTQAVARKIVTAIAKGKIPNISIRY